METKSKRRRIIQSYISQPTPDLSATFESLSDDPLTTILEFVGRKSYRSFGGINKHCKEIYLNTPGMTKETFLFGYGPLSVMKDRYYERLDDKNAFFALEDAYFGLKKGVVFYNRIDILDWAFEERDTYLLSEICPEAIEEERFDLLNKVWNNMNNEDNEEIFEYMDSTAASCGKLNVIKWLETKGLSINKEDCAESAASGGHPHILKWLREEKGLELKGKLYYYAIDGGQLHAMKRLREQGCPWAERSRWDDCLFVKAAVEGHSDILQWLHDEGCPPWPEYLTVREFQFKPEVVDWCRSNGYSNRIRDEV